MRFDDRDLDSISHEIVPASVVWDVVRKLEPMFKSAMNLRNRSLRKAHSCPLKC